MIKMLSLVHRKSGLTHEEFCKYWLEKHGPLVARIVPWAKRYIQNHIIQVPGMESEWDGYLEMYFDDLAAFQDFFKWRKTSAAKELLDDENKFIDPTRTRCMAEEHIII